jgi:hypothetical protein
MGGKQTLIDRKTLATKLQKVGCKSIQHTRVQLKPVPTREIPTTARFGRKYFPKSEALRDRLEAPLACPVLLSLIEMPFAA